MNTQENIDTKDNIVRDYMDQRDRLLDVWGWNVQQISNRLLYHAVGITELLSNERVDLLGSELTIFIHQISTSLNKAVILFPNESIDHIDMFIKIIEPIQHPRTKACIEFLQRLKQWYRSIPSFTESNQKLLPDRIGLEM